MDTLGSLEALRYSLGVLVGRRTCEVMRKEKDVDVGHLGVDARAARIGLALNRIQVRVTLLPARL